MADGSTPLNDPGAVGATKADLVALLDLAAGGAPVEGLEFFDTEGLTQFLLPNDKSLARPLLFGDDLLLVQPDGTVVVLLGAANGAFVVQSGDVSVTASELKSLAVPEADWSLLSDAKIVDLRPFLTLSDGPPSSSVEPDDTPPNQPLEGLAISPLLPPTAFRFPGHREDDTAGGSSPDVGITQIAPVSSAETDAAVVIRLADYFDVEAGNADFGERITEIGVQIENLPTGTTASDGVITGGVFTFVGPPAVFQALTLTFPKDFSTESRIDAPPGDLPGEIYANSNFGAGPVDTFTVTVTDEPDLAMRGPGAIALTETDAPVLFAPKDAVAPVASDIDGSERVTSVALVMTGLPAGAEISFDGGTSFSTLRGPVSFSGSLAEYDLIVIRLPADFSTENPASTISGVVTATTNEDARETRPFNVTVDATPDVTVTAPAVVSGVEDGNGADGSGVTVDLDLVVAVTDADGSEDATVVTLTFTGLPAGSSVNGGNLTGQVWTGTVPQANALTLTLPGDYSGTIPVSVDATSPEGSATTSQSIQIAPAGDVDLSVAPIVTAETDAVVDITPSASWQAGVSDFDPALPRETLTQVVLTLDGMPPGVTALGVPAGTVSYDAAAGGTLVFTGTEAQYLSLQLRFPADYSTESPSGDGLVVTGTLEASSNEGSAGPVPVRLRITPEGDGVIDDTLPDTVPDETDAPTTVVPSSLLLPAASDADGSEAIDTLQLVVEGLPGDGSFTLADVTGLPAGATATLTTNPADGSATLTVQMDAAGVGDVAAAYAGISIELPADFSTANRSDLTAGTARPLDLTLDIQTDEDQDPTTDTPTDGTVTETRTVDIGFEPDIALTAPAVVNAVEDGGGPGAPGVTVDLNIDIAVTDIDGSETESTADPRFAAGVEIVFVGLPAGTTVNGGTLAGGTWTGSAAEAEALQLGLPGDYSGTITNTVTVTTPEGSESTNQSIVVAPSPDFSVGGAIVENETDAPVEVTLSDFITVTITDPDETVTRMEFNFPGLPAGTTAADGNGDPIALTPGPGGTVTFDYVFVAGSGQPDPSGLKLTFPADYSTTSPVATVQGTVAVTTTDGGPISATIPVTIDFEGDVVFADGTVTRDETDAVVTFKPNEAVNPAATDADGSELITQVTVNFNALPPGSRFSVDDGASFSAATPTLGFTGTLAEYDQLVIELPADFSTESPGTTLTATITATSNEPVGPDGTGSATLTVNVSAEGDIALTGPGTLALTENDAPGDTDDDATTQAPLEFRPYDALRADGADADGSESLARADVTVSGLPSGTTYSTGGAFAVVPAGPTFTLSNLTAAEYQDLTFRLPDDFSTESPASTISGSVTFTTDEAILAGETEPPADPANGVESAGFSVTVDSEADVDITVADITVIEDLGTPIPLNLDASVTDIDGSEAITSISVAFSGLPTNGPTVLTDGTNLTGPSDNWTGTLAQLQALGVTSFPQHFSGIVTIDVTVVTDEGSAAGTTDTMLLNVTPVAEPTIVLTVREEAPNVVANPALTDSFVVKEDTSFLLLIDAETPDRDGSESLTQVVIQNVPAGWLPDGALNPALIEAGAADIASAVFSGTTLTLTLNAGVVDFDGAIRISPAGDEDRDVATITGSDLEATVTSVDTAAGLPSDTANASDGTDVDLDAVVDPITLATSNSSGDENVTGFRGRQLNITNVALQDVDGSEGFQRVEITLNVATESDPFDPTDTSLLQLRVQDSALRPFAAITQTGSTATSVTYEVVPAGGATDDQFASALESLQVRVGQHVSAVITTDGTVFWTETRTTDTETDLTDNPASQPFSTTVTIRPVAEAELDARVFVTDATHVTPASPTELTASADDSDATAPGTLTLKESTDDGSGVGQVFVFVGMSASTPDNDGSEELQTIVIQNIPTSWIDEVLTGTTLDRAALFSEDGLSPISNAEYNKIASATYDATTGELTLTFVPDVTAFDASLRLQPALYEDYDVDRDNSDPFTADGSFFADDLVVELTTVDSNSATSDTASASTEFDVDVDPVNNIAFLPVLPVGNEGVIDAAGGIFQIPISPIIRDVDGSETITAVVFKDVPSHISIYVEDPANPAGPKIPALLTEIDNPPGFNTWSLENDQWLTAEARGVTLHTAGDFPVTIDVVTTEDDGGGTGTTTLNEVFRIDPVADGGNPSESVTTDEDTAVHVQIDGNIIDNTGNSPASPEAILDGVVVSNVQPDSFGRYPRFFDGPPAPDPATPGGYLNELGLTIPTLGGPGSITLTATQASNLWVLPGKDTNEDLVFDVTLVYYETIEPTEATIGTGTITVNVTGVADDPVVDAQDPASYPDDPAEIAPVFRPTEVVDGVPNSERVYGYAGFDSAPFLLDSRLRDIVIDTGVIGSTPAVNFTQSGVTSLTGDMTEILVPVGSPAADFDGSETVYYLISDVPPGVSFAGVTPADPAGESYVVTASQLATIEFVPEDVSVVTYYDLKFTTLVLEDDESLPDLSGLTPDQAIAAIDALKGGATESVDFTIVVVPDPGGGGGTPCLPEQELPLPVLELIGSGDEDTEIPFKIKITPNPPFYDSIDDLANLPNGVSGSFGLGISLPPGSSLSSDPPGAVLYDPVSGLYVVDFAVLGVDPTDPTQTQGTLLFTPPAHESSPANPFAPGETFGPDDPYDSLDHLDYQMILQNFTCGTSDSGTGEFAITINPVVDGPDVRIGGGGSFPEDTLYALDITVTGIDGGERPVGDVTIDVDGTNGGQLLDATGTPLTGTPIAGGFIRYTVALTDLAGLQVGAREHYSGPLEVRVTATAEDIDGSTRTNTATQVIDVIPVADVPDFAYDNSLIDPDTGLPFVDTSVSPPVIQAIEDVPFNLSSVLTAESPDQDGSEIYTVVISGVPNYLAVTGGPGAPSGGIINNGDGSYTISSDAYPFVQLRLKELHARTPDALDPVIADEIPLTVTVNTYELANADENSGSTNFVFKVRPDADTPTLTSTLLPATGTEDDGGIHVLVMNGVTPDQHEDMEFHVTLPDGGILAIDGVVQTPGPGGVYVVPATAPVSTGGPGAPSSFQQNGTVTITPPPDFSGTLNVQATAVTIDTSVDGSFTDTEPSTPADLSVTIAPAPDLVVNQTDDTIVLPEGDPPTQPNYRPADEIAISVTDTDGSETVDQVFYTLTAVPTGTTYTLGGAAIPVATADLNLTLTEAEFNLLEVQFPQNYATNGAPLNGSVRATTNEGGDQTVNFTVDVTGELDLEVTVSTTDQAQDGAPLDIPLGISASLTPPQTTGSETPEEVVVQFTAPLPVGTTVSAGTLSADRQTLTVTRGASTPADFLAVVAALTITVPGTFSGPLEAAVTGTTNHGTTAPVPLMVDVNDQPAVSGAVDLGETSATSFSVPFSVLLDNTNDGDLPLTVTNVTASDPDVQVSETATGIDVTVTNGFAGMVTFSYDVTDNGSPAATSAASAELDLLATIQLVDSGLTTIGPGGATIPIMDDADGQPGQTDVAQGTNAAEAVIFDPATRDYAEIERFALLDGDDLLDFSLNTTGVQADMGGGGDRAIGGSGSDRLDGGDGADTLTGGTGADVFVLSTGLSITDVITDYEAGTDQIDLSSVLTGSDTIGGRASYDSANGELTVLGDVAAQLNTSPGFPTSVEVIFEDASGAQATAVL